MAQHDQPDTTPTVSIGMPVYNDEKFIREALDSLLAQDFEDFELIISDNASKDATQRICLEYAARDPRIRYYRNEVNLGSIENFNRVFGLAFGKYFMWASGHDLWSPSFLYRCIHVLEEDSSVVVAYSRAVWIENNGRENGVLPYVLDTRGLTLIPRFNVVIWTLTHSYYIYGLIRSDVLRRTRLARPVPGTDHILLMELSLIGAFAQIQEPLFYLRKNRAREQKDQSIESCLVRIFGGRKAPKWPHFRMCYEQLLTVRGARAGVSRKIALIISTMICAVAKYHPYLLFDLKRALGWQTK